MEKNEEIIMQIENRTTDSKGRLVLPKSFANATVILEIISDTEIRLRKARVVAEDDLAFTEEAENRLSDRDRDRFLALLGNPPAPSPALKKAARRRG
jgi:hypothetical protein